jgi:hypothetical protein
MSSVGPKQSGPHVIQQSAIHPNRTSWHSHSANPITEALPVAHISIKLTSAKRPPREVGLY